MFAFLMSTFPIAALVVFTYPFNLPSPVLGARFPYFEGLLSGEPDVATGGPLAGPAISLFSMYYCLIAISFDINRC